MSEKIILEAERLILREYEQTDYKALFPILSDLETIRYYPKSYDAVGVQH